MDLFATVQSYSSHLGDGETCYFSGAQLDSLVSYWRGEW